MVLICKIFNQTAYKSNFLRKTGTAAFNNEFLYFLSSIYLFSLQICSVWFFDYVFIRKLFNHKLSINNISVVVERNKKKFPITFIFLFPSSVKNTFIRACIVNRGKKTLTRIKFQMNWNNGVNIWKWKWIVFKEPEKAKKWNENIIPKRNRKLKLLKML